MAGVKITEHFAHRLKTTVLRVDSMPEFSGNGKIPVRFEDRIGSTPAASIRLGQFSGYWPNEPGQSGSDNIRLVKLYVQNSNASGPNDWVPELDGDGEEVIAVTLNLFSYIPTRSGNDSYMWCAVLPISNVDGEYFTGSYQPDENGADVPVLKPYTKLWLLLAAEC